MLHPSTKRLIDKLSEMTRKQRVAWVEGDDGTVMHDTEGYRVVLTPEPHAVLLTDALGKEIETCPAEDFIDEQDSSGRPYTAFIADLYREAHRHARGAERAISTLLKGLESGDTPAPVLDADPAVDPADLVEDPGDDTDALPEAYPDITHQAETADIAADMADEPGAEDPVIDMDDVAEPAEASADEATEAEPEVDIFAGMADAEPDAAPQDDPGASEDFQVESASYEPEPETAEDTPLEAPAPIEDIASEFVLQDNGVEPEAPDSADPLGLSADPDVTEDAEPEPITAFDAVPEAADDSTHAAEADTAPEPEAPSAFAPEAAPEADPEPLIHIDAAPDTDDASDESSWNDTPSMPDTAPDPEPVLETSAEAEPPLGSGLTYKPFYADAAIASDTPAEADIVPDTTPEQETEPAEIFSGAIFEPSAAEQDSAPEPEIDATASPADDEPVVPDIFSGVAAAATADPEPEPEAAAPEAEPEPAPEPAPEPRRFSLSGISSGFGLGSAGRPLPQAHSEPAATPSRESAPAHKVIDGTIDLPDEFTPQPAEAESEAPEEAEPEDVRARPEEAAFEAPAVESEPESVTVDADEPRPVSVPKRFNPWN
ncbi:hypothetical protein [Hyphomonas johnsonii]|uniref:Uncharacterized protein n=1 Tax=Hyphomonas johnsonii MHS-2 TaxID=1280950 RepID=A0A059F9R2_9PROT|nr:hypothetical protein [Hyphomonas johnsonii]KCZ87340.1 hypothetical protein HJO_16877 [Hyphomonas johnsonii MHS-2]